MNWTSAAVLPVVHCSVVVVVVSAVAGVVTQVGPLTGGRSGVSTD